MMPIFHCIFHLFSSRFSGVIFREILIVALGGVLAGWLGLSVMSAPRAALAQQVMTPTPNPQMVATVTAASDQMAAATARKQRAAQLQAEAEAARAGADAEYLAAQQAAQQAQQQIQAQQFSEAYVSLNTAQVRITSGMSETARLAGLVNELRIAVDGQTATANNLRFDVETCRSDVKQIQATASAAVVKAQTIEDSQAIDPVLVLVGVIVVAALLALGLSMRRRVFTADTIIDQGVVFNDSVDDDDDVIENDDQSS